MDNFFPDHALISDQLQLIRKSIELDPKLEKIVNETKGHIHFYVYQNQQFHNEINDLNQKLFLIITQRNELVFVNSELFRLLKESENKLKENQEKIDSLVSLLDNQKSNTISQEELNAITSELIAKHNQEVKDYQTTIDTLRSEIDSKDTTINKSTDDFHQISRQLNTIQSKNSRNEEEISRLTKLLESSEELFHQEKSNHEKQILKIKEIEQSKYNNLQKELCKLKKQIKSVEDQKKSLEDLNLKQSILLNTKEEEVSSHLQRITTLQEEIISLKTAVSNLELRHEETQKVESKTPDTDTVEKKKKKKKKNKKSNKKKKLKPVIEEQASFQIKEDDISVKRFDQSSICDLSPHSYSGEREITKLHNNESLSRFTPLCLLPSHLINTYKKEEQQFYASICPHALKNVEHCIEIEKILSVYPTLKKVLQQHSQTWIEIPPHNQMSDEEDEEEIATDGSTWPHFFKTLNQELTNFLELHLLFRKKNLIEMEKGTMAVFVDCFKPEDNSKICPMSDVVFRFSDFVKEKYKYNINHRDSQSLTKKLIELSKLNDKCVKSVDYVHQIYHQDNPFSIRLIVLNISKTVCSEEATHNLFSVIQ